jgi:hypothetical protein
MAHSPQPRHGLASDAVRVIVTLNGNYGGHGGHGDDVKKQKLAMAACLTFAGSILFMRCLLPPAHADSMPCFESLSSYVTELDRLLSKEKNWIRPFKDLNQKYFPLRDCEINLLLHELDRSSFLQSKYYDANTKRYFIVFSNGDVEVGFNYVVSDNKSEFDYATFTRK